MIRVLQMQNICYAFKTMFSRWSLDYS